MKQPQSCGFGAEITVKDLAVAIGGDTHNSRGRNNPVRERLFGLLDDVEFLNSDLIGNAEFFE